MGSVQNGAKCRCERITSFSEHNKTYVLTRQLKVNPQTEKVLLYVESE